MSVLHVFQANIQLLELLNVSSVKQVNLQANQVPLHALLVELVIMHQTTVPARVQAVPVASSKKRQGRKNAKTARY